jgi:hypothetical protein
MKIVKVIVMILMSISLNAKTVTLKDIKVGGCFTTSATINFSSNPYILHIKLSANTYGHIYRGSHLIVEEERFSHHIVTPIPCFGYYKIHN